MNSNTNKENSSIESMLKNSSLATIFLIVSLAGILFSSSCVVTEKSVYFNNLPDSGTIEKTIISKFIEPVIQNDDLLAITVQTIDPSSAVSVNQAPSMPTVGGSTSTSIMNQSVSGFLVDKNGEVSIPMLGKLKLSGLTTYEARALIEREASRYFKDPNVQVRFANYKITLIGEVARPATYTVANEKVSLLDAIGLAGDLTIHGKRENVLLVRDNAGRKEFVRFNLNSTDIFKSPYFYLKQNDVIYVEPGKGKVAATNIARTQTISIITAAVSIMTIIISRLL